MSELAGAEEAYKSEALGALIGRGRMADVYQWGPDQVVKLFSAEAPTAVVEHEAQIAIALTRIDVPAPVFGGRVQIEGRPGLVFERVDARSMVHALTTHPWQVGTLARRLADLHRTIHEREADSSLPPLADALHDAIVAAPGLSTSIRDQALRSLRSLPVGDRLCHGDFHPDNVLLASGGPVAIDWPTATRGCPAADVARTLMILRHAGLPPGVGPSTSLIVHSVRRLLAHEYRRHYQAHSGMTLEEIESWRIPIMAARLRENMPDDERLRLRQMLGDR